MLWIIIFSFAVLMALAIAIYLMPMEQAKPKKKQKDKNPDPMPQAAPAEQGKDWQAIAERWEKHNQSLQGEVGKIKMDQKKILQEADAHKAQAKDLLAKLSLEKGWREKEQAAIDKFKHHEKDLKDQIFRTEQDLEKEHSNRLSLERELQEIKIKHGEIIEEKRQLSIKAMSMETSLREAGKELKELRMENAKLKEKREDVQWVAKSEFDELKKELARFKQTDG